LVGSVVGVEVGVEVGVGVGSAVGVAVAVQLVLLVVSAINPSKHAHVYADPDAPFSHCVDDSSQKLTLSHGCIVG
jgi:hypothetical protein